MQHSNAMLIVAGCHHAAAGSTEPGARPKRREAIAGSRGYFGNELLPLFGSRAGLPGFLLFV